MRIVYLIGNGLDVKLGLKTRYEEFYKNAYTFQENDSEEIRLLKEEIKNNITDWADLEKKLGEYSTQVDSESTYLNLFKDIRNKLVAYMAGQEINFALSDSEREDFINKFREPYNYLVPGEKNEFNIYIESLRTSGAQVDFITFNYTRTLEMLLDYKETSISIKKSGKRDLMINQILHVHGYTDQRFVLGVDNEGQISNENFRNKKLLRTVVKPLNNMEAKHLVDKQCKELINNAHIICIYGMSIGETDKSWWAHIGVLLYDHKRKLIIFWWDNREGFSPIFSEERLNVSDEIKDKFLSQTSLEDNQKEVIRDNIYIVYKQEDIFNIPQIII